MTAYTGSIDTTLDLNDGGTTDLWTASSSGSEYYYNQEFPLTTYESVDENGSGMTLGTIGSLTVGQYVIGDNDSLGANTLYARMSDDGDPDGGAALTISIEQDAHCNLLHYIKTVLEAESWVTQRYDTSDTNHELIIFAPGYSGTDEIYCGFYAYQDSDSDYYNMVVASMTGYVSGNTFFNQPGIWHSAFCCHNLAINYWLSVTGGRINGALKVGTPVYESFTVGNFLPFAPVNQWPQPLICGGTLNCTATQLPTIRFDVTTISTHSYPWKAYMPSIAIRDNSGDWIHSGTTTNNLFVVVPQDTKIRPIDSTFAINTLYFQTRYANKYSCFGYIDGIYNITGFENTVENTMVIDAENYVVIQNINKTGHGDFVAMALV